MVFSTSFLIEFRLHGFANDYAKWAKARIHRQARILGIREMTVPKVSHITLFGGAETNNFTQIPDVVERIGSKYSEIHFKIGGFNKFQNPDANWIYLNVNPSRELEKFRYELGQAIYKSDKRISDTCKLYDIEQRYIFYCAVGKYYQIETPKIETLLNYAESHCKLETFRLHNASIFFKLLYMIKRYIFRVDENYPFINQHLIRVTILGRKNRIEREYDLILRKMLTRREAFSRFWWRKTIQKLKRLQSPNTK